MAAIHVMMVMLGLAAWNMEGVAGVCCNSVTFFADNCTHAYPMRATGDYAGCDTKWEMCHDCSTPTPYCGYGGCNIFACNCDGGCRTGPGSCHCESGHCELPPIRPFTFQGTVPEVASPSVSGADIVKKADADQDGRLSYAEARAYLQGSHTDTELQAFDADNDGFITANDIDG